MFYRIFLYKMFASLIFIFTFATGNKSLACQYAGYMDAMWQNGGLPAGRLANCQNQHII